MTFQSNFTLKFTNNDYCHAFVGFFECTFSLLHKAITFSTSPHTKYTHWKQVVYYLIEPVMVCAGEEIEAAIQCKPNNRNSSNIYIYIYTLRYYHKFLMYNNNNNNNNRRLRYTHFLLLHWCTLYYWGKKSTISIALINYQSIFLGVLVTPWFPNSSTTTTTTMIWWYFTLLRYMYYVYFFTSSIFAVKVYLKIIQATMYICTYL